MSRDILLRILLSVFIAILIFALHRVITVSPSSTPPMLLTRPILFAHRGGSALAPENTLPAFRNGAELGADALELDVRLTADGELVVVHDESLERTTNGIGNVRDSTLSELKRLDAGYRFTTDDGATYPFRDQGITIPTIAEVYKAFPDLLINIDIKDPLSEAADRLAKEITSADAGNRTIVASFHNDILGYFRSIAPDVATATTPNETRNFYLLSLLRLWRFHRPLGNAYQIPTRSGRFQLDSSKYINHAHRMNQQIHYWTIDDPEEMRRLLELGADGIITDRPDLAAEVFKEMGFK